MIVEYGSRRTITIGARRESLLLRRTFKRVAARAGRLPNQQRLHDATTGSGFKSAFFPQTREGARLGRLCEQL